MSMDIAILDEAGFPSNEISVSPNAHWELMRQVEVLSLPLLARMHDYYEDVDYTVQETILLGAETDKLVVQCNGKPQLCSLLEQLQTLVHIAGQNQKNIVVIAD